VSAVLIDSPSVGYAVFAWKNASVVPLLFIDPTVTYPEIGPELDEPI